jgi:hypothetical protein
MPFGTSVVTLKRFVEAGVPDELGNYELDEVPIVAPGCRHRPLTFKEAVEFDMDIATQPWKTTVPLAEYDDALIAALIGAEPDAVITVDGQEYQVVGGVRPHPDMDGTPFKATIISQKQIG